jgi:hypothetical protein
MVVVIVVVVDVVVMVVAVVMVVVVSTGFRARPKTTINMTNIIMPPTQNTGIKQAGCFITVRILCKMRQQFSGGPINGCLSCGGGFSLRILYYVIW